MAYTAREKIIKFEGCYQGHADMPLVKAGSGVATLGLPDSPGVPKGAVEDTLVARYNDLPSVQEFFIAYPGGIAAVIVEPVAGNRLQYLRYYPRSIDSLESGNTS